MSFKTDRLTALFPDAYAAREGGSLLHAVLDALGNEFLAADQAVKELLKSHWIAHARGGGLDGLGALLGVQRRLLADGTPEGDDTFRPLVQSTVPSFIGGGTVAAVQGAVRAALGLPYDLAVFQRQLSGGNTVGPPSPAVQALITGLQNLVQVQEFSPKSEVMVGSATAAVGGSSVALALDFSTIEPLPPRIEWTFAQGGRQLSLLRQDTGTGVRSKPGFAVAPGATLVLSGGTPATFSASIDSTNVSEQFTAADGSSPPSLPAVPSGASTWIFTARQGAAFDASAFDAAQPFDSPAFSVRMLWLRLQPLVFDVIVPYFVDAAVQRLIAAGGPAARFSPFKGLTLDAIQMVVDRSRAAGVRGMVQYAVRLPAESAEARPWDDHAATETLRGQLEHRSGEVHDVREALTAGALDSETENHAVAERFVIGGNFNVAVFDGSFGFL